MNAVVTTTQPKRSITVSMSERYGMDPRAFEATLRATVCKGNVSPEEFAAFLLVAHEYKLNPAVKEIYAFPAKGGGIQPIVSIDGWARIINNHPMMDGMEFSDVLDCNDQLVAVTCRLFRKDRSRPTEATEYLSECKRDTDVWRKWPGRMLRHKALIQCARYAFGFGGLMDEDEFERAQSVGKLQTMANAPPRLHGGFDEPAQIAHVVDETPSDEQILNQTDEPERETSAELVEELADCDNPEDPENAKLTARLAKLRAAIARVSGLHDAEVLQQSAKRLLHELDDAGRSEDALLLEGELAELVAQHRAPPEVTDGDDFPGDRPRA